MKFSLLIAVVLYSGIRQESRRLLNHLLGLYNTLEIPIANFSVPLKVTIGLKLLALTKVSEPENAIQTNMLLNLSWNDYNMIWNSSEYANLRSIQILKNKMWTPDIRILNQFGDQYTCAETTENVLKNDGTVINVSPGHFATFCSLSIQDYPFEEQKCTIEIGSWSRDQTEVVLLLNDEIEGSLEDVHQHINWKVTAFHGKQSVLHNSPTSRSSVTYEIHLRRKGMPIYKTACSMNILICSIIILSAFLSPTSSFKINAGMFGIIICYFVEMRFHLLPFGSEDGEPPRIAVYFQRLLLVSLACLVTNALAVWMYYNKWLVPSWLKSAVVKILPILKSIHPIKQESMDDEKSHKCNGVNNVHVNCMGRPENQEVSEKDNRKQVRFKDQEFTECVSWEYLAIVTDRLFFWFWVIFIVIFSTVAFPSFSKVSVGGLK